MSNLFLKEELVFYSKKNRYFRRLFYGIHLPFSSQAEDSSTQIVRILEDELTCFNTKKRAPYRIVVETIE